MAGERWTRPVTAGGLKGARLTRRSKVGERPDGRAPPVGVWHEKEKGGSTLGQLGPAYTRGRKRPTAWDGSRAERKRKGRGKRNGPAGEKEREEREKVFPFFLFIFFFKFVFQTLKLQSNRNPCIRDMMHKHLLFLDYFSDV
jgi:hypothetical protein